MNFAGARVAILVVSDRVTPDSDESGRVAERLLERSGHRVVSREIIPNDRRRLSTGIRSVMKKQVDLIMTIGGTGISRKDISVEVVSGFLGRELPGFGELFRRLSFVEIGTASIMSRAVMGTACGRILLAVPGSPAAVRLALEKIVLKELDHILSEVNKS